MSKNPSKRDDKPTGGKGERKTPKPPAKEKQKKKKLDIVEEAGEESFPASDPPPWTP